LLDGLAEREAVDLLLVLESAGIATRLSRARHSSAATGPVASRAATRPTPTWMLAVDPVHHDRALLLIAEHRQTEAENPPAAEEPLPPASAGQLAWLVALLGANIAVWVAMTRHGAPTAIGTLVEFGATSTRLLASGEWWRSITAVFVHIGTRHLLGNGMLLLLLGLFALRTWGTGRTLFLYLTSGIAGNWAGFFFGSAVATKAGASGAILGLLGGLAGARLRAMTDGAHRSRYKRWHVVAMLVAFYGFVVGVQPTSDHPAHIGGLLWGAALAWLWDRPGRVSPRTERTLQVALGATAVTVAIVAALLQARAVAMS
jgi:membrane associated rhomboid family serine protease